MARTKKQQEVITHKCSRTGFSITGTPDEVAEHFYRDKSTKSGFSPWCKDAEKDYNKASRAGRSMPRCWRWAPARRASRRRSSR
jgi:hypothetical protein